MRIVRAPTESHVSGVGVIGVLRSLARSRHRAGGVDWSGVPGFPKIVAVGGLAAWVSSLLLEVFLGGTAVGAVPVHPSEFFVVEHGIRRPVTEPVWLLSLVYTTVSQVLPFVGLWLLLPYLRRIRPMRAGGESWGASVTMKLLVSIGSAFGLVWCYAAIQEATTSLRAWLQLR